jgi:hypothetical protein
MASIQLEGVGYGMQDVISPPSSGYGDGVRFRSEVDCANFEDDRNEV